MKSQTASARRFQESEVSGYGPNRVPLPTKRSYVEVLNSCTSESDYLEIGPLRR